MQASVGADELSGKWTWKQACLCATTDGVPRRSLLVALVVGTILNVINQGDVIFGGRSINWPKLILTYFVPYAVCTYGAVSAHLRRRARTQPDAAQPDVSQHSRAAVAKSDQAP